MGASNIDSKLVLDSQHGPVQCSPAAPSFSSTLSQSNNPRFMKEILARWIVQASQITQVFFKKILIYLAVQGLSYLGSNSQGN